jgi:hypothetical protein
VTTVAMVAEVIRNRWRLSMRNHGRLAKGYMEGKLGRMMNCEWMNRIMMEEI